MTARQLPEPSAVEIGVSGRAVRGIQWDWEQSDISLLMLHEPGADLDNLRWLADRLVAAGVSVLSIDLPGHGLSDGDRFVPAHGQAAVRAALGDLVCREESAVAVLAQGQTAGLLLQTEVAVAPVAAVLLDPRPFGGDERMVASWHQVPKLALVPSGSAYAQFAAGVLERTNAWGLQADLHGLGAERTDIAEIQVASITLKFTLELAAFELASRRRRSATADGQEVT
jgi:pimeloyl-ACP methyl ester carboxylesterase